MQASVSLSVDKANKKTNRCRLNKYDYKPRLHKLKWNLSVERVITMKQLKIKREKNEILSFFQNGDPRHCVLIDFNILLEYKHNKKSFFEMFTVQTKRRKIDLDTIYEIRLASTWGASRTKEVFKHKLFILFSTNLLMHLHCNLWRNYR